MPSSFAAIRVWTTPSTVASPRATPSAVPSASPSAAPPRDVPEMPTLDFAVPSSFTSQVAAARERGRSDAASWVASNPTAPLEAFRSFVIEKVGAPPTGAALAADEAAVRDAVRGRDEMRTAQALWIDEHGLQPPWRSEIDAYTASAGGPAQAAKGLALLAKAGELSTNLTFAVKDLHARARPFQVDPDGAPLLAGVTHVRGGAFPSGHASTAFVNAAVLDSLVPARTVEHAKLAEQLSYARTYAAAHYPSDHAAGAYIGSAAAAFVQLRPDVEMPPRVPKP